MNGENNSGQANGTNGSPQEILENFDIEILEKELEKGFEKEYQNIDILEIEKGKQDKHIKGTNNFMKGRGEITISIRELQKLLKVKAGSGKYIGKNKERVDFGKIIGIHVNGKTGERKETTIGIIHYSKKGVHVVPGKPKEGNCDVK